MIELSTADRERRSRAGEGGSVRIEEGQSLRSSLSRERLVLVVAAAMLGMLLSAIDQTVVGTAMPRIIADLNGLEHYSWVFTAYMLASTATVPLYGKLSDVYGRRPFFLLGLFLFVAGSALSGQSQSMTELILFRGLQGLGAGAMMPIVIAIIGDIFPPAERGRWQGLMMAVFGLATIVGPTLGGWITDHWTWRWVFYVNLPVGIVAMVIAAIALPSVGLRRQHRIDYPGAAVLIAAAVPMLLGFSWAGTEYAWGSPQILSLFAGSAVMWVLFFWLESRAEEPIISPSLFRNSIFTISMIATFIVAGGLFGGVMYLPLFMQGVIGDTATNSGTLLTPMMLGFMASSIIGGQLLSRTGRYKIISLVGFAVAAVGMYLNARLDVHATNGEVIRNMIIMGLGMGVQMSLFTIVVQNAFPFRRLGEVTASLQFFRSIGGTIGVAVLGTLMTNRFQTELHSRIPPALSQLMPAGKLAALENPQALLSPQATAEMQKAFAHFGPQGELLFRQLMQAIRESLAVSITELFAVGTAALVAAFVVTLFLKEIPLRRSHEPGGAATEMEMETEERAQELAGGEEARMVHIRLLLGSLFAILAGTALRSEADRGLLEALAALERQPAGGPAGAAAGDRPAQEVEEAGRRVARELLLPAARALLDPWLAAAGEFREIGAAGTSAATAVRILRDGGENRWNEGAPVSGKIFGGSAPA
ncbi:MAG: MDR family MFS transporter [Bacillota bacterium]|nr:MDR family MFS transporter [Bacillota bacterium]